MGTVVATAKKESSGSDPLFAPQQPRLTAVENKPPKKKSDETWKVMIIDDEKMVHDVSHMLLKDFTFNDVKLEIIDGYSGEDARQLLQQHPDTAVMLLDVVMETDDAGLQAVRYIREELKNQYVRIILRTGQPGQAPEHEVITKYDINDYRDKSELTAQKLYTALTTALRAYNDIKQIESLAQSKALLEQRVRERTKEIMKINEKLQSEITERIATNEKLQKSQNHLAEAQRIAKIGSFDWNLNNGDVAWSDQIYLILGFEKNEKKQLTLNDFMDLIPEGERALVLDSVDKALSDGSYAIEHSIIRVDGKTRYAYQQGKVLTDENNNPVRLAATIEDITEKRNTEAKMQKLSSAIEQIADAVMITNHYGEIEYVNNAFTDITGYRKDDVLGKSPNILKSGKHSESFYQRLWHTITAGKAFSEVFINRRQDGTLYHEVKTITPMTDAKGDITHYISSAKDITERMQAQERLEHLAHHDPLTNLPNRTLLQDRLNQILARSQWHDRYVAVMFLDMDRFKVINDTLGHDIGDKLLQEISKRLNECVRHGDTVARLGGDEFAIILNDIAKREDIENIARKILDYLAEPTTIKDSELFITTSIGISLCPGDGVSAKALLKKADVAMYQAKAAGKNNYQFYTEADEAKAATRIEMEAKLRRALENGEFSLNYQPQINLMTGKILGFEALLRWKHPHTHHVSPGLFIPILEETGLVIPVGEWVLRTACADEKQRQKETEAKHRVSVNVSIRQFQSKTLVRTIEEVLTETGLDPSCLELEITEGLLIEHLSDAADILQEINAMGVSLSIDDFGTGYSSMNYLKRLPFDTLKIDKSFVNDISHSQDDAAIAAAIITLAHTMDMQVIAEGVETADQLKFLYDQNCDAIQGFLFSRPIPNQKVKKFIEEFYSKRSNIIP